MTGTVQEIDLRFTVLRGFDGAQQLVPNTAVLTEVVEVRTGYEGGAVGGVGRRRLRERPAHRTRGGAGRARGRRRGCSAEPAPTARVAELGVSTVDLCVRWWTAPQQDHVLGVRDEAVSAVKTALDAAGVEMPADVVVLQGSPSLRAALHRDAEVTPGGGVR